MSWAKFDDRYDDNRKVKRLWRANRAAVGLHVMSVTYCARHETDGMVDIDWLEDKLPQAKERQMVIDALTRLGGYELVDAETYRVHDYLDYNDSHETLAARRKRDAERKAKMRGKDSDGTTDPHPSGVRADESRSDVGRIGESKDPDPTRPDPTAPTTPLTPLKGETAPKRPIPIGRKRDNDQILADWQLGMNAWIAVNFPDADTYRVATTANLVAGAGGPVTVERVQRKLAAMAEPDEEAAASAA